MLRARALTALFELTHRAYALTRRRAAWGLSARQLADMPADSLGRALGELLLDRGFELIPRLESHDLMHLLTGVGADVVSEVELQFTLLGNGKRSLYLLGTVALGLCVYPEHAARFLMGFRRGQRGPRVFDVDGLARLAEPLHQVPQLDAR